MIAEINGKISRTGSNLSDRLEDQLTGNFFGSLRYLPFEHGIKTILQNSVYPKSTLDCLPSHLYEWHNRILFWESFERTEPDVIIELDDVVILIEVKLHSGLSSDDNPDEILLQSDEQKLESRNQLARESRLLIKQYPQCKKKFLILLAPEDSAAEIYRNIKNREKNGERIIEDGVDFGYITWQKTLIELSNLSIDNAFQKLVVQDLTSLLRQKGFERFDGFNYDIPNIDKEAYWQFNYTAVPNFVFGNCEFVTEDMYYEFK
ncbi:MAG: hypothetical protein FWF94_07855 [Oscillospiraceae bacterium]|nr:hypothetical protein [Oscillospiraceae bacterium]